MHTKNFVKCVQKHSNVHESHSYTVTEILNINLISDSHGNHALESNCTLDSSKKNRMLMRLLGK